MKIPSHNSNTHVRIHRHSNTDSPYTIYITTGNVCIGTRPSIDEYTQFSLYIADMRESRIACILHISVCIVWFVCGRRSTLKSDFGIFPLPSVGNFACCRSKCVAELRVVQYVYMFSARSHSSVERVVCLFVYVCVYVFRRFVFVFISDSFLAFATS